MPPQAVFLREYQPRSPQVGEVTGNRRLGRFQHLHDIADTQVALQQQMQDAQPRAVRKRPESHIDKG